MVLCESPTVTSFHIPAAIRPTLIFTIFNLDRSITAPITPSRCNVSSTFSSLLSTLIPPHKKDQIYSGHRSGICSKEDIQGVFTCWLAVMRLEKRLSLVKWSTGKKQPLSYLVKVWYPLRMLFSSSCFTCCQTFFGVVGFLTLDSKCTVWFSDMLPAPAPEISLYFSLSKSSHR